MRVQSSLCLIALLPGLVAMPATASGLSGAASMRVEVQVYKGPVGQNAAAQIGELTAVMAESVRTMRNWLELARGFYMNESLQGHGNYRCGGGGTVPSLDGSDCHPLRNAIQSGEEIVSDLCGIFPAWVDQARFGDSMQNILPGNACSSDREGVSSLLARPTDGNKAPVPKLDYGSSQKLLSYPFEVWRPGEKPVTQKPEDGWRDPTRSQETEGAPVVLASPLAGTRPSFQAIIANWQELDRRIAGVAAGMKSKAFRVADANVAAVPRQRTVRTLLATFGFISSEYANQIQSRLAILAKQMIAYEQKCPATLFDLRSGGLPDSVIQNAKAASESDGSAAAERKALCGVVFDDPLRQRTFPMSDYLRDAGTTDFLHLYDWLGATLPGGQVGLGPEARTRMAQRLTDDYYWARVNEVYASGQGDVSMAFIKDELGNWNLKSFSNDPGALLDGYRKATGAALKAVATLAGGVNPATAGKKLGLAEKAAGLAKQLATGEAGSPATVAGLDVKTLHQRTAARLAARQAVLVAREADIRKEQAGSDAADAAVQAKFTADLKAAADDARTAVTDILDDHLAVIAALQEGVAGTADAAASGTR